MVSNRRSGGRNTRVSTRLRNGTLPASQRTRSRRQFSNQLDLESLRSMIVKGRLGIFKLSKTITRPSRIRKDRPSLNADSTAVSELRDRHSCSPPDPPLLPKVDPDCVNYAHPRNELHRKTRLSLTLQQIQTLMG
jgi:hypothetical protein